MGFPGKMSILGVLGLIAPWRLYESEMHKKLPAAAFGAATLYFGYTRGGWAWTPFALWAGSPVILMAGVSTIMLMGAPSSR